MTTKEKRERRGQLAADMAKLELRNADGSQNIENIKKFDAMDADQKALKEEIDREERAANLELELRGTRKPAEGPIGDDDKALKTKEEKRQKAFVNYLRHGLSPEVRGGTMFRGISDEERALLFETRDINSPGTGFQGSGGQGAYPGATTGFFVPVGFEDRIESAMKYYGDMLNVGEIFDTATGQVLPFPTDNDTTVSGEIVGEGQQVSDLDVSLGQINFGAWKFSSKMVRVSIELLQDSAFDLESYLTDKFATRTGRILNTKFTIGTGSSQPTGIMVAATVGVGGSSGTAVIGDLNAASTDPTSQVGYEDLVNLEHSVDPLYRKGAMYMFHDTTLRAIKILKDKYGRPLWVPGIASNAPDTVLGYRYSINNDMDQLGPGSPAVTKNTVAYGLLKKYLIRRVKQMTVMRLVERFADYGQVGFIAFSRYDGNLLDAGTHPVKYLQNPA